MNVSMILVEEAFIKYANQKSNGLISVVALIYVFCGYTLYFSVKHTFFVGKGVLSEFYKGNICVLG